MKTSLIFIILMSLSTIASAGTNVTFLYEAIQLKADTHSDKPIRVPIAVAKSECQKLGGRLPTNREWASEVQRLSQEQTIFETQYPEVQLPFIVMSPEQIRDPGLQNEALQMKSQNAFLVPKVNEAGRWVVDFYYKSGEWGNYYLTKTIRAALGSNQIDIDSFYTGSVSASSTSPFMIEAAPRFGKITPQSSPENEQFVCVREN